MDLVSSCKDKLTYFRIKELKDILTQLGLSKQGKKQDLADRILAILSDDRVPGILAKKNVVGKDQVAKLVDDTYRRMQNPGATDLASKSPGVSASTHVKLKEEIQVSPQREKLRCLCGSSLATDSMIKCEDTRCSAWQHIKCVVIPEGGATNPPETFYCEICRLTRADPFLVTVAHSLYPVKLNVTSIPVDGSSPGQSIEKTFQLTRADRDMLLKQDVDLQAWCMLLNDKVAFRMQWPQYADLQINGVPVRVINRPGSQLLGANGRDDGPLITPYTRDGINKIALTGCDTRIFCVGVRIVKRRALQQVLSMIPKEDKGEPFEEALARVRRCVGGGAATENADSDSDIEVVADSIPVNLRCPMSGLRMKVAGRFKPCLHMGCFDLDVFVEMNQRSRKWQCPICLKNYSLEKIIIDPYFNRITSKMQNFGEDLAEIEVKPDGSWRAKLEGDQRILGELALWHFPDGTKHTSMEAISKPKLEPIQVKMEGGGSDSHPGLKIGIKKNQNGCWVFNKPNDVAGISPANNGQNVSSSSSGRDFENVSVNQDSSGNREFTVANGLEYESLNGGPTTYGFNDQIASGLTGNNEIIVLSDSDDEIEPVVHTIEPVAGVLPFPSPPHHVIPDNYFENPTIGNEGSSQFDIYNSTVDDFGVNNNMWSGIQGGPGFQLFGANTDANIPEGSMNCPTNVNGYTFTADTAMRSNEDTLVDNPLSFSGNDPSLQIFLPTGPSDVSVDLRDLPDVSNVIRSEDWFSLRLGDGGGLGIGESSNALNSGNNLIQSKDGDNLDSSLADSVTVTPSRKTAREKSDSPFSFPRQKRSVRPRLNLSIDSPSE